MEEASNLNFSWINSGGASEFPTQNSVNAEAGRNFFSVNLTGNKLHELKHVSVHFSFFCII